jgi:hypothetical protein
MASNKPLPKKVVDTILATANGYTKEAILRHGTDPVKLAERSRSIKEGLAMDLGCPLENISYVKGKGWTHTPDAPETRTVNVTEMTVSPHVKMPDDKGIAKGDKPSCRSFAVADRDGKVLTWLPVKGARQIVENLRAVVAKMDDLTDADLARITLGTLRAETDSDKFKAIHAMIVANFPEFANEANSVPEPSETNISDAMLAAINA